MKLAQSPFAYRLALALGQPNPEAMLARMPYRVWLGWIEYSEKEPFNREWDGQRADWRASMQAAMVANCLVRQKGQRLFVPDDFMPSFSVATPDAEEASPTPDDLLSKVMALNFMFGGNFIDNRESNDGV